MPIIVYRRLKKESQYTPSEIVFSLLKEHLNLTKDLTKLKYLNSSKKNVKFQINKIQKNFN